MRIAVRLLVVLALAVAARSAAAEDRVPPGGIQPLPVPIPFPNTPAKTDWLAAVEALQGAQTEGDFLAAMRAVVGALERIGNEDLEVDPRFPGFEIQDLIARLRAVERTRPVASGGFLRGDADGDGAMGLIDALRTLGVLFTRAEPLACEMAADTNDNGRIELADALFTLHAVFLGGQRPPAPSGTCGSDPTPDTLSCARPSCPTSTSRVRGRGLEYGCGWGVCICRGILDCILMEDDPFACQGETFCLRVFGELVCICEQYVF